ncbi:hypothetical protein [Marivirga arenosa]|jgi:hypothetical protein|uniref:Uncharacterized protein n=1 Tax=Marivirga arenosa TaxID=3059076 RepID=A0AA49GCQ1_9BACT|nr:hypothetical protein [Marivirga sp. BKB1-2]WKK81747.2 hypothetical protein QYS47_05750 [Marivirga sp. BKB1-2]
MKKSKTSRKNIKELKKLGLFGDSEKDLNEKDMDSLGGGKGDTTVDTQWPTVSGQKND